MKLYQLAYACRLYQGDFDKEYREMRGNLGENPDLASEKDQDHLLDFLNKWGCRIPKAQFPALKSRLRCWAETWVAQLPPCGNTIFEIMDIQRDSIAESFRDSIARSFNDLLTSHFQGTCVAKTLHVLRPHTLPPWDRFIKEKYCGSEEATGQAYLKFIKYVIDEIKDLEEDVKGLGYSLKNVPCLVKRVEPYGVSLPKLVDEYHWMTITNGHRVPDRAELAKWLDWIPPS